MAEWLWMVQWLELVQLGKVFLEVELPESAPSRLAEMVASRLKVDCSLAAQP